MSVIKGLWFCVNYTNKHSFVFALAKNLSTLSAAAFKTFIA